MIFGGGSVGARVMSFSSFLECFKVCDMCIISNLAMSLVDSFSVRGGAVACRGSDRP